MVHSPHTEQNVERDLAYYAELEVALQHIWLYAYVTEKTIDEYFCLSDRQTAAKTLSRFYSTLIKMTLIVNKYESIGSRVHARDSKVFAALKESSNISCIIESVRSKSDILEKKLQWAINVKSLGSDRLMESLLFILTIFQCVTALGMSYNQIVASWVFPLGMVLIVLVILLRLRK